MAEAMTARSEQELVLDDNFLEDNFSNPDMVIDCFEMTPITAFVPACRKIPRTGANHRMHTRGLHIDSARNDSDAQYALLNRSLGTHSASQNTVSRYTCGNMHPESIRFIYPSGTTARGIHVHA